MAQKTQQEMQVIFDILVTALIGANDHNRSYIFYHEMAGNRNYPTPLTQFLDALKKAMKPEDFDETFLSELYHEVFYTGSIPSYRNHILMNSQMALDSSDTEQPTFIGWNLSDTEQLTFWVDLDKAATLLNAHMGITPPYSFTLEYGVGRSRSEIGVDSLDVKETSSELVNSRNDPIGVNNYFILGCVVSAVISVFALLVVALAAAAMIALSTMQIEIAAGVGLGAGLLSYGFFKRTGPAYTKTVPIEPNPERIETMFQEHFKDMIDATSTNRMG
ncbi:MAG: hypothetical protein P1U61_01910 [Legionellaceae bacterium]|nr:hypothetical protein [Legionellaceae bacterium]